MGAHPCEWVSMCVAVYVHGHPCAWWVSVSMGVHMHGSFCGWGGCPWSWDLGGKDLCGGVLLWVGVRVYVGVHACGCSCAWVLLCMGVHVHGQPCAYVFVCMGAHVHWYPFAWWVSVSMGVHVRGCSCGWVTLCVGSCTCEQPHLTVPLPRGEAGSACGDQGRADLGRRHPER